MECKNKDERFECTFIRLEMEGKTLQGSWRHWATIRGIEWNWENSVAWPPEGSDLEKGLHEFAIGHAVLLGAQFWCGTISQPTWTEHPWRLVRPDGTQEGFYATQGSAALQYLARRGYWVARNTETEDWELVKT